MRPLRWVLWLACVNVRQRWREWFSWKLTRLELLRSILEG